MFKATFVSSALLLIAPWGVDSASARDGDVETLERAPVGSRHVTGVGQTVPLGRRANEVVDRFIERPTRDELKDDRIETRICEGC